MPFLVSPAGLDELITILRARGPVIGPVRRDGVITHGEIEEFGDLPAGWSEEQDGGTYRLVPTGTDEVFAFSSPSTSWKRHLQPERTLLVRARRSGATLEIDAPEPASTQVTFFGIRSCDLAALGVLDRVFLDPDATDPTYATRRRDAFVVAVACNRPGTTCFCASMQTGPSPTAGYDLAVRELHDAGGHRFLVEVGSESGAEVIEGLAGFDAAADEADEQAGTEAHDRAVAAMGRRLDPADPPLAARAPDHPQWDDVARRCLACGNCTMVCPTCFCSTTEDTTGLDGTTAERWRVWDSCFSLDFSHLHGGSVRTSTRARYRQWLLHKLVTWHDQFGTSGCVGCGRCITWCPVGIDLTAEVAALTQDHPQTTARTAT